MNIRTIIVSLVIINLFLVQSGCDQAPTSVDAQTGSAYGYVVLHDAAGNAVAGRGVTASLVGTSDSTVTDSTGYWSFKNVQVGYAEVIFTKPGYFSVAYYWYEDGASDASYPIPMGLLPTFTVDSLQAVTSVNERSITFTGKISVSDSLDHYIALLFYTSPIDTTLSVNWFRDETTVLIPKNSTSFSYTLFVDLNFYLQNYIGSGSTLYVTAYPLPAGAPFVDVAPDGSAYAWRNQSVRGSNSVTITVP